MASVRKRIETEVMSLGPVEATVVVNRGPRIVGFARSGGPQLFAVLPDEVIDHSDVGTFSFLGGHRLWRAPEIPAVTYQPDDEPVAVDQRGDGVWLTGAPDADGIVKVISLRQREELTMVDHTLRHDGTEPVRCAAWAITQLTVGGFAVLPQSLEPVDADGVLPNRSIVLWPYTDPSAPEIEFGSREVRVTASSRQAKTKIGQENRRGWIAYVVGNELFVKWGPPHRDDREYADRGSSVECYRDERFLELESLSPLTTLLPGHELHHREIWMLADLTDTQLDDALASLPVEPAVTTS